jgi:hypothetical protein
VCVRVQRQHTRINSGATAPIQPPPLHSILGTKLRQDLDKASAVSPPARRTCLVAVRSLAATVSSAAECTGCVLTAAHLQAVQQLVKTMEV